MYRITTKASISIKQKKLHSMFKNWVCCRKSSNLKQLCLFGHKDRPLTPPELCKKPSAGCKKIVKMLLAKGNVGKKIFGGDIFFPFFQNNT